MKAVFLRALEGRDKERTLRELIGPASKGSERSRFFVDLAEFASVPRAPFAYWVGTEVRGLFKSLPLFEDEGFTANVGLQTSDDFRFLRAWWETPSRSKGSVWSPFAKGGTYSPYYSDVWLVVRTAANFAEGVTYTNARYPYLHGNARSLLHAEISTYLRPGLTWPLRTKSRLSFRVMPAGCVFSHKGPAALTVGDEGDALLSRLAVAASSSFEALVALQLAAADAAPGGAAHSFEVGVIQRTPVPRLDGEEAAALAERSKRMWTLGRSIDTRTENSHAFSLPAVLQSPAGTLTARAAAWFERIRLTDAERAIVQAEIDERSRALYGIGGEGQTAIPGGPGGAAVPIPVGGAPIRPDEVGVSDDDSDTDSSEVLAADVVGLSADALSWSLGVAFGRFDIRFCTGERPLPADPGPFDPLPVCSPGMLTGDDGLPLAIPPSGFAISFPPDGILLDDAGHPRDLLGASRAVFDVVFRADADARWNEVAELLDPKGRELRGWFARTFFERHIRMYSKSRRKAPIYWQLATSSASYSVWLYAHRLTPDTFFHVLHDVVAPKLGLEERKLLSLTQEFGPNPTASQRKEIAAEESFVDELRAFRDEVTRVAPLWKPDLDDGVVLSMAPLWRLVPQHRAWQKELKAAWDSLCAGEYDWAHVAMHLWPERVVPKCATDRSLGIAHGLEEVFWEEDAKGKWAARKTLRTPVATLVAERTSPAVKAALKDLLEAPIPGGAARATGRGKRRNG